MHLSSTLRMQWFVKTYADKLDVSPLRVLDVGSYDVNGSYRSLFSNSRHEYCGLDVEPGPNVDMVLKNPYDWSEIKTESYDVVISGQAFEHVEFFWVTMSEMARVLKKDGLLCIIAPNGFCEHRYPVDCYRFFTDGMIALARYVSLETLHAHTNSAPSLSDVDWYSAEDADSMLVARKPYAGGVKYADLKTYKCVPVDKKDVASGLIPYEKKLAEPPSTLRRIWRKLKRFLS